MYGLEQIGLKIFILFNIINVINNRMHIYYNKFTNFVRMVNFDNAVIVTVAVI